MGAAATPRHIVERNRRNAKNSTGPRTPEGMQIARANALRHGLTANPASGVSESPEAFGQLLAEVEGVVEPQGPIELALVHQVAVAIWRLQRAALADGAVSEIAARRATMRHEQVRAWIDEINRAWAPLPMLDRTGAMAFQRPELARLDERRTHEMHDSWPALTAMSVMIEDLVERLARFPAAFRPDDGEQLAWLLGESAIRLPSDHDAVEFPDTTTSATKVDQMIGTARVRGQGEPLSRAFVTMVRQRLQSLSQQARLCEDVEGEGAQQRATLAALLPEQAVLDRLARYEGHAQRSLERALRLLAEGRGVTVAAMRSSLRPAV